MNFVFISPNFPIRYYLWCEALAKRGVRVLGVGDTPYDQLDIRLKNALTEYYWVSTLNDRRTMIEAVGYFERKYGKIDYIESNNEWWLYQDAVLREWFDVKTGFFPADMNRIKAKSAMKEYFQKAGVKTMRYILVDGPEDKEKASSFVKEVGWPVFVKPNVGVGASDSYALRNKSQFDAFFSKKLPETYIMEEYIEGSIVSFDGICDSKGDVVFCTSDHFPVPVADLVNDQLDDYYWTNPFALPMIDVDAKTFEEAGRKVVKSFGISKRFFHIEFFVLSKDKKGLAKKGEFVALECNMRAPGGNTPDLINFAESTSVYDIYADVICFDENRQDLNGKKYYAFTVGRRDRFHYVKTMEEIASSYPKQIKLYGRYDPQVAVAMGDEFIYAVFPSIKEGVSFVKDCCKKKDQ